MLYPPTRAGSAARRSLRRRFVSTVLVGSLAGLAAGAAPASASVDDFPVPTPDSGLTDLATGRDGSLWFSEQKGGKVGRITTAGQISEWTIPRDGDYGPEQLTVAQDGRVWVLSGAGADAYVIDPTVPGNPVAGYQVNGGQLGGYRGDDIASAPDGTVWVTSNIDGGVLRIAPNGQFSDTRGGPPDCDFDGILAPGPDGKMWCADNSGGDALKRVELDGVNNQALPIPSGFAVSSLTAGPGGAMWYGRNNGGSYAFKPGDGAVGRVTPAGDVKEWKVGDRVAPTSIATGPDNAVWFGSAGFDQVVGRVTPDGKVTTKDLGVRRANAVAFGGDGALWFIDTAANRLTRITRDEVTGSSAPATGAPSISSTSLRVSKGRVPVRVTCPPGTADRCRGTLRLRTTKKVKAGGKTKAIRTLTSSGRYTISPGKTGTVRVKLTSTGRKLIRRGRTSKASVQATPRGTKKVAAKRTVTIRG